MSTEDVQAAEPRTLVDLQRAQRVEITKEANDLIAKAGEEGRSLTAEESEVVLKAAEASREIDEAIAATVQIVRGNETAEFTPTAKRSVGGAVVRSEPMTYARTAKEAARSQHSFVKDHTAVALGLRDARDAQDRLQRHAQEMDTELRAGSTTDSAGGTFVPPLWVLSEYVEFTRAGRATADLARQLPLPAGTDSINIPTITTGTKTAIQATENSAVTSRDMVTSSTTADVTTIAGIYDFSIQLMEQSALAGGWDSLVFMDMVEDYNQKLDVAVVTGSGASNQPWGIQTVSSSTVTVSTAAGTALYAGIADGINRVSTTRYKVPQVVVMHPRRWFWLASRTDTTGRPLVNTDAGAGRDLLAAAGINTAEGVVGVLGLGLPVVIDANVPTTTSTYFDDVYVWRPSDAILMEGTPRFEVFRTIGGADEPLTVRARLYNYAAFTTRFATSVVTLTGAGLTGPTF